MQKKLATIFSRLLDPVWEIPIAFLLAVMFAVSEGLRWRFLGLLLFVDAGMPFIFFLAMLYHHQITDWDIQKRRQRLPLYVFTLICHLGGIWLAIELGKQSLAQILIVFYAIAIVFFAITTKWKISLHAGVNMVLVTFVNWFTGWHYVWLYLLVLAVAWARVYQKHHTWAQVVAGAVLAGAMTVLGLWILA